MVSHVQLTLWQQLYMASLAWYHYDTVPLSTLWHGTTINTIWHVWYVALSGKWCQHYGTPLCHIVALVTLWHCNTMACKHYDMVRTTINTMAWYYVLLALRTVW